ncbi:MAG: hypothetical protein C4332_00200 [Meiothermus sp.]
MKSQRIRMSTDEYLRLPWKRGWKYEYNGEETLITPRETVRWMRLELRFLRVCRRLTGTVLSFVTMKTNISPRLAKRWRQSSFCWASTGKPGSSLLRLGSWQGFICLSRRIRRQTDP